MNLAGRRLKTSSPPRSTPRRGPWGLTLPKSLRAAALLGFAATPPTAAEVQTISVLILCLVPTVIVILGLIVSWALLRARRIKRSIE